MGRRMDVWNYVLGPQTHIASIYTHIDILYHLSAAVHLVYTLNVRSAGWPVSSPPYTSSLIDSIVPAVSPL